MVEPVPVIPVPARRRRRLVALGLGAGLLAAGVLVTLVVVCLRSGAGRQESGGGAAAGGAAGGRGGVSSVTPPGGFDPNDLERTAEWAKSLDNRLRESERAGNDIRLQHDRDEVGRLLATHTGKEVRWRFRVKRVNTESVELLRTTWSVPVVLSAEINRAYGKAPGEQTGLVVFFVEFYQPVPDRGPLRESLPVGATVGLDDIVRARLRYDLRESLPVGATVSPKLAARLSPGDFITVRGKVHNLAFGKTLYISSNHAIQCILSEASVAE